MSMYEYQATIVRVIDGDTVAAVVDLGFHVSMEMRLRLAGINAPEMRGADAARGLASKLYLESLISDATYGTNIVTIATSKDSSDKYGRYLAEIVAGGADVNQQMISAGHAVGVQYK